MDKTWNTFFQEQLTQAYMQDIRCLLDRESYIYDQFIYPPLKNIYKVFDISIDQIKVVILNNEPYCKPGLADGLAFSVAMDHKPTTELMNIFYEIQHDLAIVCNKKNGNLERWSKQGVFLLNKILTVRHNEPNSHSFIPWDIFTNNVLALLSKDVSPKVFMLWGDMQSVESLISQYSNNHLILKADHPNPLTAYKGFFGCKHFSQANEFLKKNGLSPICWV